MMTVGVAEAHWRRHDDWLSGCVAVVEAQWLLETEAQRLRDSVACVCAVVWLSRLSGLETSLDCGLDAG